MPLTTLWPDNVCDLPAFTICPKAEISYLVGKGSLVKRSADPEANAEAQKVV